MKVYVPYAALSISASDFSDVTTDISKESVPSSVKLLARSHDSRVTVGTANHEAPTLPCSEQLNFIVIKFGPPLSKLVANQLAIVVLRLQRQGKLDRVTSRRLQLQPY